ncbi:hypothetical protein Lal_00004096, partial [Lupinus albus]
MPLDEQFQVTVIIDKLPSNWKDFKNNSLVDKIRQMRCCLSQTITLRRNSQLRFPNGKKLIPVVVIHCDSTATIENIENHFYNGKKRQIRRKHNTKREFLSTGADKVDHVRTENNLADPLTKGPAREKSWDSRLSERFLPGRERLTWEGEILGYTEGFSTERELARLGEKGSTRRRGERREIFQGQGALILIQELEKRVGMRKDPRVDGGVSGTCEVTKNQTQHSPRNENLLLANLKGCSDFGSSYATKKMKFKMNWHRQPYSGKFKTNTGSQIVGEELAQ